MAIPHKHKGRYIFHFTDIRNLDSIIKNGLLCTNLKNEKEIKHKNIANQRIQERRARMDVPVGPGGKVHDYVPFYFSSINPMLLSKLIQKNVDQPGIIYFCVSIDRLEKEDAVFTDASANTAEAPEFFDDTSDLDELDWEIIDSKSWKQDSEEDKHKKMAEALIASRVDISEISHIVVYNEHVKKYVQKIFDDNGVKAPKILFDGYFPLERYKFYYTKFFFGDRKNETLVTGPEFLKNSYETTLKKIKKKRSGGRGMYRFETISDLIAAIEEDFSVLPELKGIIGLYQDYSPHDDFLEDHTKKVVRAMKSTGYYKKASETKKSLLVLAAYLHDIGKGPKKRWDNGKMPRPYTDHPADAAEMLVRILSEEVRNLTDEDVREICMLVIYHDIIGDCLGKGRDKEQLAGIVTGEDDFEMLCAIALADTSAIGDLWATQIELSKAALKAEVMDLKRLS